MLWFTRKTELSYISLREVVAYIETLRALQRGNSFKKKKKKKPVRYSDLKHIIKSVVWAVKINHKLFVINAVYL